MTRRKVRVALLGHVRRAGVKRVAARVRQMIARRGGEVRVHEALADEMGLEGAALSELGRWCHVLVSLGGDGTALTGARAIAGRTAVLLPVNLGGLGFLTVARESDLADALRGVLDKRWPVSRRRMVGAIVRRSGRVLHRGVALNDAVVKGGYAAIHLRMRALGADLGHVVADGLIAATASGSTAYSLSAGGPVLAPNVEALVVTPACPHTLVSRSLVLPADASVHVRLIGSVDRTLLLFDGQEGVNLRKGDEVEFRLERKYVRLAENPDQTFAQALLGKLGWQGSEKRSL